jgi:type II secretory pathway component PulM
VLGENANQIATNSSTQGKELGTTVKTKRKESLEVQPNPIQPHAGDTSANHALSHEEIRRRAYEIYLDHGSLPGNELDDWLQAERELQKVARFSEDWNRLQRQRSDSGDGN